MRAGTLRERITLELPVPVVDAQWGPAEEWQEYAQVSASVVSAGATEKVKDEGVQASERFTVRMRWRSDVLPTHRIIWRGRTLDITGVTDPDMRRRELVIEAKAHG